MGSIVLLKRQLPGGLSIEDPFEGKPALVHESVSADPFMVSFGPDSKRRNLHCDEFEVISKVVRRSWLARDSSSDNWAEPSIDPSGTCPLTQLQRSCSLLDRLSSTPHISTCTLRSSFPASLWDNGGARSPRCQRSDGCCIRPRKSLTVETTATALRNGNQARLAPLPPKVRKPADRF